MRLIVPIILLAVTSHAPAQNTIRRDVLLMVDSIEMAYAQACPEIPLKTVAKGDFKNDINAVKAINKVYYDSLPFTQYRDKLLSEGFAEYSIANDTERIKLVSFYPKPKGNLAIGIRVKYKGDSILAKEVRVETETHPYCLTKNGIPQIYFIDIYYIRRLVYFIGFPFTVGLAEPTDTKQHWDELKP